MRSRTNGSFLVGLFFATFHVHACTVPVITAIPSTLPSTGGTVTLSASCADGSAFGAVAGWFVNGQNASIAPTNPASFGIGPNTTVSSKSFGFSNNVGGNTATVTEAATYTTVTASPNPSTVGQAVTAVATVHGASPTGTVTFFADSTNTCVVPLSGTSATCTFSNLTVGQHSVGANYSGDAKNTGANGSSVIVTVKAAVTATTTILRSSQNPAPASSPVTFTATVTGTTPTGTVSFTDNGTALCSAGVSGTGNTTTATCTTSALTVGSHTIKASYPGDTKNGSSNSSLVQTIVAAVTPTTTTLTSSVNPTFTTEATELQAVITGSAPTGTVTFVDGVTPLCSNVAVRTINSVQLAYCVATLTTTGTHSLVAQYSGDSGNAASVSSSLVQTVNSPTAFDADQFGLTGAWYNAATTGAGFLIDVLEDNRGPGAGYLFAGWFTYDVTASGGQRWYTFQGPVSNTSPSSNLVIYAAAGSGNFNATPVVGATAVGTAVMTFADCTHATVQYTFTDGSNRSGTLPITRLTAPSTCSATGYNGAAPTDYLLSGAWYNAPTSGQGILFDISPAQNLIFAAWYTYALNGASANNASAQRWFTLQGTYSGRSTSNVPIYTASGGVFNDPTPITGPQVGTANLTFASCSALSLDYSFTSGEFAGQNGTIAMTPVGPVPVDCQ